MNCVEVQNLSKKFKDLEAVKGISFSIQEGELFGLLGPNGAGKTTTLNMLSTMMLPTSGKAFVCGVNVVEKPDEVRKNIGMVFQDPALDLDLTARENLQLHAELYGLKKEEMKSAVERVLALVDLKEFANKQVRTFSGGMKRRLEIARGLMHRPRVLFLDEPTLGLDPQTRATIWTYVQKLAKQENMTIILTTHYLDEADALCNRIAIIDHGKIVAMDTPTNLKKALKGERVVAKSKDANELAKLSVKASTVVQTDHEVSFTVENASAFIPKLVTEAQKKKIEIETIETHKPSLDDVFLQVTGKAMRDAEIDSSEAWIERARARRRM
ncbi:MAG: ATP-binding cassette domain-containing protein [Candidatus Diapherotrites archaeon]